MGCLRIPLSRCGVCGGLSRGMLRYVQLRFRARVIHPKKSCMGGNTLSEARLPPKPDMSLSNSFQGHALCVAQ